MTKNSKSAASYAIEISKLWINSMGVYPIDPLVLAQEYSSNLQDKIFHIQGHDIPGIEGVLCKHPSKNGWLILFNKTIESPGRINFTIAHEFGHYVLHRNLQDDFKCDQGTMVDSDLATREIENEANTFASYLLMPIDDFRQQVSGHKISYELISHCADRYKTSFTASAIKLISFTEQVAALVITVDDIVLWSSSSQNAKKLGIYYTSGSEFPASIASNKERLQRIGAGILHKTYETQLTRIDSDRYDMCIYLLVFPDAVLAEFEDEKVYDSYDQFLRTRN